ncbi:MAG TPA: hypothetical protein VGF80_10400 [Galbitalea sp.]|jgi:hypothetical protein
MSAVLLRSQVQIFEGATIRSSIPAGMELHDDDRFLLLELDPATGAVVKPIIDTPVTNLDVNPSATYLQIASGGISKRVVFAAGDRVPFPVLGVIGMEMSRQAAVKAGLNQWIAVFKQHGVLRKFTTNTRNAIVLGVGILIVAAVIVYLVVANVPA